MPAQEAKLREWGSEYGAGALESMPQGLLLQTVPVPEQGANVTSSLLGPAGWRLPAWDVQKSQQLQKNSV